MKRNGPPPFEGLCAIVPTLPLALALSPVIKVAIIFAVQPSPRI